MSTHINHIEINNFKSIQHQVIDGCKKINVFIGQPNVGKSAILEIMSFLAYVQPQFNKRLSNLCRLKFFNELFTDGNISSDSSIIVNHSLHGVLSYVNEKQLSLTLSIDNQDLRHTVFTSGSNTKETGDKSTITNKLVAPPLSKNASNLFTCKKYKFQNKYFNDYKTDALNLQFPHGENLVDIIQFNKELRKEVIDLFRVSGLIVNIDQGDNSIRGYKQLEEGLVFTIPFYQMADTLQRLIFHKAAILSNKDAVLLFEEPEAHMFPPYVRQFTGDIISNIDNNQYFIATHSPVVLEDFLDGAIDDLSVYLVSLKNGQTVVKRLSEDELKEVNDNGVDLFFNIESYLD